MVTTAGSNSPATAGANSPINSASGSGVVGNNSVGGSHNNDGSGNTSTQAGVVGDGMSVHDDRGNVINIIGNRGNIYLNGVLDVEHFKDPKDRQAVKTYNRGVHQAKTGNFVAANFLFEDAVRQKPDLAPAWNNLAWIAVRRGDYRKAAHYWRKASEVNPSGMDYRGNLITALSLYAANRPGDNSLFAEAQVQVNWFLKHKATLPVTWILQGYLLIAQGKNAKARGAFSRAAMLNPMCAAAHSGLATADIYLGYVQDGVRELQIAHDLDPNDANAAYMMARIQALRGNKGDAESLIRDVLRRDPSFKWNIVGPHPDPIFAHDPDYRRLALEK